MTCKYGSSASFALSLPVWGVLNFGNLSRLYDIECFKALDGLVLSTDELINKLFEYDVGFAVRVLINHLSVLLTPLETRTEALCVKL